MNYVWLDPFLRVRRQPFTRFSYKTNKLYSSSDIKFVFRPQARLSSTISSFLLHQCSLKKSSFEIRPIRLSRRLVFNRKILPSLEIPFSYLCDSCINSWRAR
uniref:At3g06433 n=1 Tax=Arabidopsis thaliana TaxID=3702 RepID=Q6NMF1_ARATH|nr:At3g06433 [Arabidopsis thaliana]